MPAKRDILTVPEGQPNQGRKTPTIGMLLHEIRVGNDIELQHGRRLLICIAVFLVGLGAAHVAYEAAIQAWKWTLIELVQLFVAVVLATSLFISPSKIRYVAAFVLGALAVFSLFTSFTEMTMVRPDMPRLLFMMTRVVGYVVVCSMLLSSDSLRTYMGYCRALRRDKQEARERAVARRVILHESETR